MNKLKPHISLEQYKPFETLAKHGGVYICPKDTSGKRLGPLVGYAGTYASGKHFVGDVYYNFSQIEQHPEVLAYFASILTVVIWNERQHGIFADTLIAAPMGGIVLAAQLSQSTQTRLVCAKKKILATEEHDRREQTLISLRHPIYRNEKVIIVDDVCNNFSTAVQLVSLVEQSSAEVVAIACVVNRSGIMNWDGIKVLSVINRETAEYRQHHPFVEDDVRSGDVFWRPKDRWDELMEIMREKTGEQ